MLTYLINLDRSPDRLAEFMANNAHLRAISRFSAVDGRTADTAALIQAGVIRPEIAESYSPSDLGCALSHIALWEKALGHGEPITICEDDAIFNLNFAAASARAIELLPADWDLILWGWNFSGTLLFELLPGVSPCLSVFDEAEMRRGIGDFRAQSYPVSPFRLRQAFGTVSYSVSPKGARALREHCLPLRRAPVYCVALSRELPNYAIDIAMMGQYPQLQAYVGFPPLVLTRNERAKSGAREFKTNVRWENPGAPDPEVDALRAALERTHGGRAMLSETVTVSERLDDGTIWECVVHVFDLHGLPEPKRAFAWWLPRDRQEGRPYVTVLQTASIASPSDAVRAALSASRQR